MTDENEDGLFGWSPAIDRLLASWCDNAKCFEWMHTESFSLFDKRSKQFMITINCLTAIAGASNMIAGGLNLDGFQLAWIFGGISIASSTLNILQDKLGYQASSQLHKKLASDWSSIVTKIEEVITIPYAGRKDCKTFLRYVKADLNKAIMDGSSLIPKRIRSECYEKFSSISDFDIPDICGKMEHTRIFVSRPNQEDSSEHAELLISHTSNI
jgi:hypothetical protein